MIWAALACSLIRTAEPSPHPVGSTATPEIITGPLVPINAPTGSPEKPALSNDPASLLDPVCYDALAQLSGNVFVLRSQAELDQFIKALNVSGVCEEPASVPAFDFSGKVLAGAIQVAEGCSAAFAPGATARDDRAQVVTLPLQFQVESGCDYEVLAVFLSAVEPPPAGYSLTVIIQP
jgi:hypothetical protein